MLDSITVFTKGGTVLYHNNCSSAKQVRHHGVASLLPQAQENWNQGQGREVVNSFISSVLLGEGGTNSKNKNKLVGGTGINEGSRPRHREILYLGSNQTPIVVEWLDGNNNCSTPALVGGGGDARGLPTRNWIILASYPEVAMRKLHDVDILLSSLIRRYALYYEHYCKSQVVQEEEGNLTWRDNIQLTIPPMEEFDIAFQSILRKFQDQLSTTTSSTSISSLEKRCQQTTTTNNNNNNNNNNNANKSTSKKGGKQKTVWHDGKQKITKAAAAELDMSKDKDTFLNNGGSGDEIREDVRAIAEAKMAYLPTKDERPAWEEEEQDITDFDVLQWNKRENNDDNDDNSGGKDDAAPGGIRGFFSKLLSPNSPLTKSDLEAPLQQMSTMLTSKNVAPSTSQTICNAVEKQLLGKRVGTLVGVKRAVRHALEDAIDRILRPRHKASVDVLRGVIEKRNGGGLLRTGRGRPYVIVMIGINGVGKSTSLAKIAYYLQSHNCTPLLAACDTFRSGAVEQLSVHASCLSIPLYHQGYAKDPAAVAKAAIAKATENGNDVVLIDTAGRMQNNVPLMKALAKLVTETQPDLVLFVCEALVGNDGMDQLTMFQKALTSGGHTRPIDGVVLTKFDTVSDKVGAALTLTHLTGVPIVFCGTGQKYNHLKPLSVPFVIHSLFS
jgi:signal recognition particle receptor subunit alpha